MRGSGDYTMFKISKPWGYYPPEVEARIQEYESALMKTNAAIASLQQSVNQKDEQIKQLQGELRKMHIEMSSLELPEADDLVERSVLEDFKGYNVPETKNVHIVGDFSSLPDQQRQHQDFVQMPPNHKIGKGQQTIKIGNNPPGKNTAKQNKKSSQQNKVNQRPQPNSKQNVQSRTQKSVADETKQKNLQQKLETGNIPQSQSQQSPKKESQKLQQRLRKRPIQPASKNEYNDIDGDDDSLFDFSDES